MSCLVNTEKILKKCRTDPRAMHRVKKRPKFKVSDFDRVFDRLIRLDVWMKNLQKIWSKNSKK